MKLFVVVYKLILIDEIKFVWPSSRDRSENARRVWQIKIDLV